MNFPRSLIDRSIRVLLLSYDGTWSLRSVCDGTRRENGGSYLRSTMVIEESEIVSVGECADKIVAAARF